MTSTKKSRKKRKKKQAGISLLAVALVVTCWRVIKVPAVFSGIGLVIFFLWFSHTSEYAMLRNGILSVFEVSQKTTGAVLETILLDGHKYTPKEAILAAVTGKQDEGKVYIGYPLMKIDLWHIKDNLEKLTWIKHASVTRQLPSTLSISVVERQPMALWQSNGKVSLIDSDGEIINETSLEKFSNLIILVGSNVPFHAGHFLKFISTNTQVANMIASGVLVNGRRWNVKLKNDILVKLPEDNPEIAWEFLVKKTAGK